MSGCDTEASCLAEGKYTLEKEAEEDGAGYLAWSDEKEDLESFGAAADGKDLDAVCFKGGSDEEEDGLDDNDDEDGSSANNSGETLASACESEDKRRESVLEEIWEASLECDWDSTLEVLESEVEDVLETGSEERKDCERDSVDSKEPGSEEEAVEVEEGEEDDHDGEDGEGEREEERGLEEATDLSSEVKRGRAWWEWTIVPSTSDCRVSGVWDIPSVGSWYSHSSLSCVPVSSDSLLWVAVCSISFSWLSRNSSRVSISFFALNEMLWSSYFQNSVKY